MKAGQFVVATPQRTMCDDNARALHGIGRLRFIALGTRRGTKGIPAAQTRLNPRIGLITYACARLFSSDSAEWCRFALLPWFDRWLCRHLHPGDHLVSSYGYVTRAFRQTRRTGGLTFLDAGNSHIENYWEVMNEEHRRWGWTQPPFARHWYVRAKEMLNDTDYIISPSSWVTGSFLARGFAADRILKTVYVVDLEAFTPSLIPRPHNRPLRVICTGQLSLRKGTPYLLEAFRQVLKEEPNARLLLTSSLAGNVRPILAKYRDLPIDWAPPLPHAQLAERLRNADVFVLPSLEEGMARTITEAMACGLPVVVTRQTGTADYVQPGISGTVVPVRDPAAIAEAILRWWSILKQRREPPQRLFDSHLFSYDRLAELFLSELARIGMV